MSLKCSVRNWCFENVSLSNVPIETAASSSDSYHQWTLCQIHVVGFPLSLGKRTNVYEIPLVDFRPEKTAIIISIILHLQTFSLEKWLQED